jgi:hypothetical protein
MDFGGGSEVVIGIIDKTKMINAETNHVIIF